MSYGKRDHRHQPGRFLQMVCRTGYFSTYSNADDKLLARCKALKLVAVKDGIATIIV